MCATVLNLLQNRILVSLVCSSLKERGGTHTGNPIIRSAQGYKRVICSLGDAVIGLRRCERLMCRF